jgi:basic amino acid/polyamine antiporter, APA family
MRSIQTETAVPTTKQPELKRELGTWMSTTLVAGNMIGSGVFLLPAALAAVMVVHGSSSILAWAFTGIGAMLLALVFASLGRAFPRTGGPYAYAHRAFGDFAGFWTAWGYWIAAWVGNAAIATAFVGYLGEFWPKVVENSQSGRITAAAVAVGVVWVLTAINVAGVRQTGIVQVFTTILKFVPLALIGIVGLFFMRSVNFGAFAPQGLTTWGGWGDVFTGITAAAALTLWAFIGLESATVPAEEVKNARRTIPRATIMGTLATTVVYMLATIAIVGIIPAHVLQTSSAPFADAASKAFGSGTVHFLWMTWGWGRLVALVAMISTFGALNGWILIQGRIPLAAAQDGLFPRPFSRLAGRQGTPWVGLVGSSILITGLMVLNYNASVVDLFTKVVYWATTATLVPYAFVAAAQIFLMFMDRQRFSTVHMARDVIVAALGFGYAFWAMAGSGLSYMGWVFMMLLAGLPVYVYMKWRQRVESDRKHAVELERMGMISQHTLAVPQAPTTNVPTLTSAGR